MQLDQAALRLKNDETELARVKQLLAEGGVSQSDYESLELAFNVSKSSYDNLLENTILRAPVSGVVSARNYDRGDLYSMSQPIYTFVVAKAGLESTLGADFIDAAGNVQLNKTYVNE